MPNNFKTVRDFIGPQGKSINYAGIARHIESGGSIIFHTIEYSSEELQRRLRSLALIHGVEQAHVDFLYPEERKV